MHRFYLDIYPQKKLDVGYTIDNVLCDYGMGGAPNQFKFNKSTEFMPFRRVFIHHGRVYLGPVTRFRKQNTLPDEFTGRFVWWHWNKFWLQTWFYPHQTRYCPFVKISKLW